VDSSLEGENRSEFRPQEGSDPLKLPKATYNIPVAAEVRKRLKWLGNKGDMHNEIILRFLMLEGKA
jgi:hypothetical protein